MNSRTVLAVGASGPGRATLTSALESRRDGVTVQHCPELGELYDHLTRSTVHCLVVPAEVEGTSAVEISRGVTALFPDLPVVVVGLSPADVPEDTAVTTVEAAGIGDAAVAAVVDAALDRGVDSDAARPPSRMEALFLSMMDQFPVHLYAKDEGARHVITSRHSMTPTDLIGLTDKDYVELPEDHRKAAYRDDMAVIEDADPRLEIEEYTDYIDSHTLTSKVPWYDGDGDVVGLVGVTRDITERKKREHATRRQHELLVKLAVLSAHEFRNELQVALGRLELVEDDPSQIEVIRESHENLVQIVDKVINLASRERNSREFTPVWLSKLSREIWDTLETASASLSVAEDGRIVADPESASLFLQLLFDNALEHGGPDVDVSIGVTDDGFYVADDGPGIDADPPERIFDAGYTTDEGNTGFGLFVARSIADEHNWLVDVDRSEGGGAKFVVSGLEIRE